MSAKEKADREEKEKRYKSGNDSSLPKMDENERETERRDDV